MIGTMKALPGVIMAMVFSALAGGRWQLGGHCLLRKDAVRCSFC